MEFKYRHGQIRRTPSPPPRPLSTVAYVSKCPFRGSEFVPSDFSGNVLVPRVFPTAVPVSPEEALKRELEKKQIRWELEKEEIRREIIANEMALARRRELEEEVRREMASERAFRISVQRSEGISFRDSMSNNNNMFGSPQFHLPSHFEIDTKHASTQTKNKNKVIILPKPDVDHYGGKRRAVTPVVDDNESWQKKAKQEWSCELCQITATSEKGLNDHIQGKRHKAKESSIRTQRIGLDSRPNCQTLQPGITPADTGKLESREEDQVVLKGKGLSGLDNQNETASKEAEETNAQSTKKKFKFWCAFCQVGTRSEIVMQSHKNGKKHLANIKKFSQNSSGAANLE